MPAGLSNPDLHTTIMSELPPLGRQAWQAESMSEGPQGLLWESLWYTGYTTIRTVILTPICYLIMVAAVRMTGLRAMAGITLFDRLAIVAMGSLLASSSLRPTTPLLAYVLAVTLILGMQLLVAWLMYFKVISENFLQPCPQLVVHNGHFLDEHLHKIQLSRHKLYSMLRQKGLANLRRVKAVVLEGNGSLSVIMADEDEEWDADHDFSHDDLLLGVKGYNKGMQEQTKVAMEKDHGGKWSKLEQQRSTERDNSV